MSLPNTCKSLLIHSPPKTSDSSRRDIDVQDMAHTSYQRSQLIGSDRGGDVLYVETDCHDKKWLARQAGRQLEVVVKNKNSCNALPG